MAKILLIEDDPLVVKMYRNVLSFEGFQIDTAPNGTEGLKKAKQFKPDLIFLDIMMPKMNGIEVLENIKKDPDLKDTPVIMLTNLAGADNAEEALKKGAFAYMVKSEYKPKEVAQKAKEFFSKQGVGVTGSDPGAQVNPMKSQVSDDSPTMTTSPSGVSELKIEPPENMDAGKADAGSIGSSDVSSAGTSSVSVTPLKPTTSGVTGVAPTPPVTTVSDEDSSEKIGKTTEVTNETSTNVVDSPPAPIPSDQSTNEPAGVSEVGNVSSATATVPNSSNTNSTAVSTTGSGDSNASLTSQSPDSVSASDPNTSTPLISTDSVSDTPAVQPPVGQPTMPTAAVDKNVSVEPSPTQPPSASTGSSAEPPSPSQLSNTPSSSSDKKV